MAARKPTRLETGFLLLFHAALSGSVIVAYLSGDEDTYTMHMVAGYTALTALGLRVGAGLLAPAGSPLRWPRPSRIAVRDWLRRIVAGDGAAMRGRSPLLPWFAVAMLAATGLAAVSGWLADGMRVFEGLHEAMGEALPWVVAAHIATVLGLHLLRQYGQPPAAPSLQTAGTR
jgi:cytochrome b